MVDTDPRKLQGPPLPAALMSRTGERSGGYVFDSGARREAGCRHVVYRELALQALRSPHAVDDLPGGDLQGKGNAASWNWCVVTFSCPLLGAAGLPGALSEGDWDRVSPWLEAGAGVGPDDGAGSPCAVDSHVHRTQLAAMVVAAGNGAVLQLAVQHPLAADSRPPAGQQLLADRPGQELLLEGGTDLASHGPVQPEGGLAAVDGGWPEQAEQLPLDLIGRALGDLLPGRVDDRVDELPEVEGAAEDLAAGKFLLHRDLIAFKVVERPGGRLPSGGVDVVQSHA